MVFGWTLAQHSPLTSVPRNGETNLSLGMGKLTPWPWRLAICRTHANHGGGGEYEYGTWENLEIEKG